MGEAAVRVKICGVRRPEDARLALELGADAVGVLVGQSHPSSDFIQPARAAAILRELPRHVCGVLVSHLEHPLALLELIDRIRPGALQIHSGMQPEAVQQIRRARPELLLSKAVHCNIGNPLETIQRYSHLVDGFVADSCNPATGQMGGTGVTHDWSISADLMKQTPVPLWLAGGLTPDNVAAAIQEVNPWGVDVNSGVKGPDGFKHPQRLQAFIQAAKGYASSSTRSPG
jgi:phosphoribosylanthranilate isomerase